MVARNNTRPVFVGDVQVGGGAPVVVQSMTSVPMKESENGPVLDIEGNLAQIDALAQLGCELVRVAIPNRASLENFEAIAAQSPIPVIADIHFDHVIAMEACKRGAKAIRINPGNIGSLEKVDEVLVVAKDYSVPIRIGVNAGSLEEDLAEREDLSHIEKLVLSAENYVKHFHSRDFYDIVVSIKAHDVMTTVNACRLLSEKLPEIPLHLGITEAGTVQQGTIKSAAGLGILLSEGIGDTIRVSLTADPTEEIPVAYGILSAVGVRRTKPELISCPTCGRCRVNLIEYANEVSVRLTTINKPIKVAVMGCVVNGPGEAKDADVGVACAQDCGVLFAKGEKLKKVSADSIVDELMALIERL